MNSKMKTILCTDVLKRINEFLDLKSIIQIKKVNHFYCDVFKIIDLYDIPDNMAKKLTNKIIKGMTLTGLNLSWNKKKSYQMKKGILRLIPAFAGRGMTMRKHIPVH